MKSIDEINRANVAKISAEKKLPNFFPGDIIKVGVKITEGKRDRIQYFEGVCIAKKIETLTHHLQSEKYLLVKALKEHLLFIVQLLTLLKSLDPDR